MNYYFDNASTSYPKPTEVAIRISHFLSDEGGTYGRAAYPRIRHTTELVENCRDLLSTHLGIRHPERLFFCSGATFAANALIQGSGLRKANTVWISPMEHNAVMRPLISWQKKIGYKIQTLPHETDGKISIQRLNDLSFTSDDRMFINHVSNVNGVIQPVDQLAQLCRSYGMKLIIDGSQSVGHERIDLSLIDPFAFFFAAHKGMMGPTGIGAYYCQAPEQIDPLLLGGTGSRSDSFDMPDHYPDRNEAGTPNTIGIIGWLAALESHVPQLHSVQSRNEIRSLIGAIPGIRVYSALNTKDQSNLFSLHFENCNNAQIADLLSEKYSLATRYGLHCAPAAHRTLGTYPHGLIRISFSPYHSDADLAYLYKSLLQLRSIYE